MMPEGMTSPDLVGLIERWVVSTLGLSGNWAPVVLLGAAGAVAAIMLTFVAVFAGPVTWVERRVAGRLQSRIGPNRVGPQGILQWLADGIKNLLKEDLIPEAADSLLFRLAPYLVFGGMFGAFVVLPFSAVGIAADLDIGIVYVLAITSIVVVGLIMSGWASNNKWSLLGGMRAAAQIVSYEVPTALALLVPVIISGSLSTQGIIRAQGAWPWEWNIAHSPLAFAAFFLYFVGALAEGNRTPFDIPEAESELVSGYNTEYSGFRFLAFAFAEWANLWIMSAVATTLFLGGWHVPGLEEIVGAMGAKVADTSVLYNLAGLVVFTAKSSLLVLMVIQVRWTLPRLRVDQLMSVSWKYLVPLSFVALVGTAAWMLAVVEVPALDVVARGLTFVAFAFLTVSGFLRARQNRILASEKRDWKWFI